MKYKIVLVPFPFDDLTATKVRPAVCLTDEIRPHNHIVLAFITSKVSASTSVTDFVIDKSDSDFATTGLKVSSTICLHRLMTVATSIILRELGELSATQQTEIDNRLRKLFNL
ncbi:MAG TPA: type II toxin-antitoxin system PemK/MazF family toxin [Blastocatellia bacterium]|nr:type II toxin-antitoxin system PemK/MazF family toxin [Blastocatellia bacterium]